MLNMKVSIILMIHNVCRIVRIDKITGKLEVCKNPQSAFLMQVEGFCRIIRGEIFVNCDPVNKVAIYKLKVKYSFIFKTRVWTV